MIKSSQSGFTMIEILVVIAMLAIIVPALTVGVTNLTVLNNRSRDLALVNMLAQNKVELLRSAGYNSITSGVTNFTSELPTTLASPKSASYTVTNPTNGIKEVVVTIAYKDYQNTRTITYKTIIGEIGVGQ